MEHNEHQNSEHSPVSETPAIQVTPPLDKSKLILPGAIVLAALMISGTLIMTRSSEGVTDPNATPKPKKVEVSIDDDPMLGNVKAKVTIVEFSDYQCPFCRSFWSDTLPQIKKDYIDTGKARLVYRDFPLGFHPGAIPAAQAANCANEQGKYWEMHDKIFSEQAKKGTATIQFSNSELKLWAKQLGLKTPEFNSCFDSNKYSEEIAKDTTDGTAAGVTGTPTFYINGVEIVGAQPYSVFKAAIEKAL